MKKNLGSRLATMLMWSHLPTGENRPVNDNKDDTSLSPLPVTPSEGRERPPPNTGGYVTPASDSPIPAAQGPIDHEAPGNPVSEDAETRRIFPPPSPAEQSSQESKPPEQTQAMTRLTDEIASLRKLITSGSRQTQTISDQAESLKSISQALRATEDDHVWDRFLKAIFVETLLILDDLGKARSALASGAADTANQILAGIETQIDQLLARHDITPMSATPDSFDPTCQKVVGIRSVPPVKSGIVESRPRRGYRYKNRVFRYEEVVIINPVKE